ncbi:MAG: hypothetical protein M0P23_08520 [Bacteroidales bacterium]|nr:hypothetical protein [Bacteroidales bacterium]MDD4639845.1 hypothetical protein [Bacteroidales bacterium]
MLNTYDENGYLTRVDDQDSRLVWEALTENARGQILTEKKGTKTTTYVYDSRGLPSSIQAPGIVNLSYDITDEGNLLYREDSLNYQKEVFA